MQVEVYNLVRHFGKTRAVENVSFSFGSGEVFGFVGPNGSGKTTTMRIMASLDLPNDGDVFLDGTSVVNHPDATRRRLGFMPDSLPGHHDIDVEEYVDFFARAFGIGGQKRHRRVKDVIEFTNLGGIRNKRLSDLSKGMKQRVSLARALVHDPDVLVLDEPAAGLDPRARIELREMLKTLAGQGKAILISSHILTELSEICSGAVIIELGKVLSRGTIEELAKFQTTNVYVMHVLGEEPETLPVKLAEIADIDPEEITVTPSHVSEGVLNVTFTTTEDTEHAAELLAKLVQANWRICSFAPKKTNLEEVFLNVTEGKVQ